jgi:hypothetical protein
MSLLLRLEGVEPPVTTTTTSSSSTTFHDLDYFFFYDVDDGAVDHDHRLFLRSLRSLR